jgi:hypothetical protein
MEGLQSGVQTSLNHFSFNILFLKLKIKIKIFFNITLKD